MFSRPFADRVSLRNGERNAITVTFTFSAEGELQHAECRATRIRCSPSYRFDHRGAARSMAAGNHVLRLCKAMADALETQLEEGALHEPGLPEAGLPEGAEQKAGRTTGDDRVRSRTRTRWWR